MVSLLVTLLIGLIVIAGLWYIIRMLPLPPPFGQIAQVILVVVALIWLIYLLAGLAPGTVSLPRS
jgi:hypothetical protein